MMIHSKKEIEKVEKLYKEVIEKHKTINYYIIDIYNNKDTQMEIIDKFCGNRININKVYIYHPEKKDVFYELIKDIKQKRMDILLMNIFTIWGMKELERDIIVHLCRKNKIKLIEI